MRMRLAGGVVRWLDRIGLRLARLPPRVTLWLAAVSSTAIFVIFAMVLYASRIDVQRAAWIASGNLVAALSQQIHNELTMLDVSLVDLQDVAKRNDVMSLPAELRRSLLFDRVATSLNLGGLFLLDAAGRVVEQAGDAAPAPLDLSQQPFFSVQRDRDVGLYISPPFASLLEGEPCIALSRRVVRDGRFAGVAVATVRLSHYKDLFSNLDLGPDGSASLLSADGAVVMRQPFSPAVVDTSSWRLPMAALMSDRSGSFQAVSHGDGVTRQFFYQHLGNLPLVQVIGRSLDDVYWIWWLRVGLTGLGLFILGNVTLVLVIAQQGELRRRHEVEAQLAVLATTDKLTGLANRRQLDETLGARWADARRDARPIALLMVDVDHFKAFNDEVGHLGGDAVLSAVAACLADVRLPPGALVARYGGEEFAIVVPNANRDSAMACGETVRCRIAKLGYRHPRSPFGILTVSVGVAALSPKDRQQSSALLDAADRALYAAKQAGRNRVEAAHPIVDPSQGHGEPAQQAA